MIDFKHRTVLAAGGIGRATVRHLEAAGADVVANGRSAPIVFLLSDDAPMITGVSLPTDGGYSSR